MGNSNTDYQARAHAERVKAIEAQLKRKSLPPAQRAELVTRLRRLEGVR